MDSDSLASDAAVTISRPNDTTAPMTCADANAAPNANAALVMPPNTSPDVLPIFFSFDEASSSTLTRMRISFATVYVRSKYPLACRMPCILSTETG